MNICRRNGWAITLLVFSAACGGRTSFLLGESEGTTGASDAGGGARSSAAGGGPSGSMGASTGLGASNSMSSGDGGSAGDGPDDQYPVGFSCRQGMSQQFDRDTMQPYSVSAAARQSVEQTLQMMTAEEKASQMLGVPVGNRDYRDIQRSSDVEVADVGVIRGFRYRDGERGVNLDAGQDNRLDDGNDFATAFPAASLRAASWDLGLERRVGMAIADETAASHNNVLLAPYMSVVRHPYWGRTQDSYGEDSYLIGRMASAMAVGIQEYIVACATHFLAANIERHRSEQDAEMNEQTLREIYARHFEMVVQDGGVGCVMAAYNLVNGVKATQNQHLLRDILKAPTSQNGMGFAGFVMSDWWAMPGDQSEPDPAEAQTIANEALVAGTDVEIPWQIHYSTDTLSNADQSLVNDAARRVLTQKYRFNTALDADPWARKPPMSTLAEGSIVSSPAHLALAEESALESAVLLENGLGPGHAVLPLDREMTIAVVGIEQPFSLISSSVPKTCSGDPDVNQGTSTRSCGFEFATDPALGDRASSRVNADPALSVGPFDGIRQAVGDMGSVTQGNSAQEAEAADAVVVVVGYTPGDEGEEYALASGGDRSSLDLPPGHADLVSSVLDLNKPTVIIVESGSIVNLPWLTHPNRDQATIWAGYPGQRGGLALGKLIFGLENFSGKMAMAWPAEHELPAFKDSDTATHMGYFFGYREFDRRKYVEGAAVDLIYPFGHGLSYSTFVYSDLMVPCDMVDEDAVFEVTVDITNTSKISGDEVAMLFVKPPPKPSALKGDRPWKELKSFARVTVPAGATVTAHLPLRIRDLRRWEGDESGRWVVDSGQYEILVGANAADAEAEHTLGFVVVDGD